MEINFGVLVFLVLLLLLLYGYQKLIKHQRFFSERGIAFTKPNLFFGNMLESFFELENRETTLKQFYNEFRREK
jgi:hypothetical protein